MNKIFLSKSNFCKVLVLFVAIAILSFSFMEVSYADSKPLKSGITDNGKLENVDATNKAISAFTAEMRFIFNCLIGFALTTSVLVFIIHFMRLANCPTHPIQRRKVFVDILISGLTTTCLALVTAIVNIIYLSV